MSNEENNQFAGSSPAMRTSFPVENGERSETRTDSAQDQPESEAENVKYPKVIRNKKTKAQATIYGKKPAYPFYRVCWRVAGKRMMKSVRTYSEAKKTADDLVADLGSGSQRTALTTRQATDALAALERLQGFQQSTGRRISLLGAVSEFTEASTKLNGRSLNEAVEGYLSTVIDVLRKEISDAVEEFIRAEEPRTKSGDGQRAQLSPKYAYNRAIMLRRFAGTFPGTAVSELVKEHLDAFIGGLGEMKSKSRNRKQVTSAKGRNHHRAVIRQFLGWCVRKDYLQRTHRLGEADAMRPEHANNGEIQFYTPGEFKALLEAAEGPMRAMIALGGLAGLRTSELLRLTWQDVWRVENHIEVTAGKSKTRQRRLVEIVPVLAAWLEPFRTFTGGRLSELHEVTWQQHFVELCENARVEVKGKKIPVTRKTNGLRHAFCTFHFAAHGNENLTAQQAGNSPSMIHQHYKGLATKTEAKSWFSVSPIQPANLLQFGAAGKE